MEMTSIRAIEGKNMYCLRPVMVMTLDLKQYGNIYTNEFNNFSANLLKIIPTLKSHYCSLGRPGGFVERVNRGTLLGHVIEHIALELQTLVGCPVVYGKTIFLKEPHVYQIVFEYEVKEVGIKAGKLAIHIVKSILADQVFDLNVALESLRKTYAQFVLGPSTKAILCACQKRDIPTLSLGIDSLIQLGYGCKSQRIEATISDKTSCIAVDIAGDKLLTKKILATVGIPTPAGEIAESLEEALAIAQGINNPVVIKPHNGNQGKGVALNLKSSQEITTAFQLAQNYSPQVLVEEYIKGRHYRALVVKQKVIAVSERIATFIIGDGKHMIKELIGIENKNPLRGENHEKPLTKIHVDPEMILVLTKNKLKLNSIPAKGRKVFLRENANLSTGGIAIDVTDTVHESNLALLVRAVDAIGLDIAGIDLVANDLSQPIFSKGGAVIEINSAPGIRMHHYPSGGTPRDVGGAIVDYLFPQGEGRIPLAVITGTNGKTTTTRLLGRMLGAHGHTVGMTTTTGVFIGDECILSGDTTGPESAKAVLMDKRVTAAVLETARGGMLRSGIAYDYADVAVITNISEDHIGQGEIQTIEDLIKLKSLVLDALPKSGYAVLNADDIYVHKLLKRVKSNVIFFSKQEDNLLIKRHLGIGGKAVFVLNGQLVLGEGNHIKKIMNIKFIKLTYQGKVSYQLENALASVGAAVALGLDMNKVKQVLQYFGQHRKDNPGRLEMYPYKNRTIVVDYGHNVAGFTETLSILKKLPHKHIRGVAGLPGDRNNELIAKCSKACGCFLDYIYLKEDEDLRGRKKMEVSQLMQKCLLSNGFPEEKIAIELQELKALDRAIKESEERDIVVIFYEKLEPIHDYLLELMEQEKEDKKPIAMVK
jgi:cyanophycin synthetase